MTADQREPDPQGPDLPGLTCVEFIRSGGFADVYQYERLQPRGRVAVKLVKPEVVDDHLRRQFAAEADAMAELAEHPHIATVFGAGTAPDGRPYLVMQFYPRTDLEERVAAQPLSAQEALRLGVQLASAVETAHRAGIIHRDIKPSNVLMTSFGHPVLSDFGIAGRPTDSEESDEDLGVSIPWSPPEVLVGTSNGSVASDVYSLAATVWQLLVGREPFHLVGGDNRERATVTRIVHSRPPATGREDIPASLDRVLQQAMAKDPAYRPQSALELARHFQRIEQELRLARTEAVVLDQSGEAVAASTGPSAAVRPAPLPAPDTDEVSTETVVGLTPPDHARLRAEESAATARQPPRRVEAAQPPRPETARRWHTSAEGPTDRKQRDIEHERRTELRPRVTPRVQTPPDPAKGSVQGSARRWLLLTAVALVVVAVGVAVLLSRGGSSPEAHRLTKQQPTDTDLGDAVPGVLGVPIVTAHESNGEVRFTWSPVPDATHYQWQTTTGQSGDTRQTSKVVKLASQGKTCITVTAEAPGRSVTNGTTKCAP